MRALRAINNLLAKAAISLAMFIVFLMVAALALSATTRFITGTGFAWFIELPPALVSWLVFPLLGPLLILEKHIEVDFLKTKLSEQNYVLIKLFVGITAFISSIIFFKAGLEATLLFYNLGQMMELEIDIPIWIMFLSFPVGFFILCLFSLQMILENYKKFLRRKV